MTSVVASAYKLELIQNARAQAEKDKNWIYWTDVHWQITINGDMLDFWPSTGRFRYRLKTMQGDVFAFIRKQRTISDGRLRWLLKESEDPEVRKRQIEILDRLHVMSYETACSAIDAAMRETIG